MDNSEGTPESRPESSAGTSVLEGASEQRSEGSSRPFVPVEGISEEGPQRDGGHSPLSWPPYYLEIDGQDHSKYSFIDLADAHLIMADDDALPHFVNPFKSLVDRLKSLEISHCIIAYQAPGGAEIPDGCSRFSMVCDQHGAPLEKLSELAEMVHEAVDVDEDLLLHLDNFTMEGEFEGEHRSIYLDERTLNSLFYEAVFYLDKRTLNSIFYEAVEELSSSTPSYQTPRESSSEDVPDPYSRGHPAHIGELCIRTHRYILLWDRIGDRKPYVFFEGEDALNKNFIITNENDWNCYCRLLENQEETIRDRVIVYQVPPQNPPQGSSRFGLVSSSADGQPIKKLEELIKLTEENVDEEPILNVFGQFGKVTVKMTIDKTRPDQDGRNIHEPLGLLSNHIWVSNRSLQNDRCIFFNVNEFLNETLISVNYGLYQDLKHAEFWSYAKEGVAFYDTRVEVFGVINTCNGEPVQALADLIKICGETVEQDLCIVGQVRNEPMEITCTKNLYWYLRPNAIHHESPSGFVVYN